MRNDSHYLTPREAMATQQTQGPPVATPGDFVIFEEVTR